MTFNAASRKDIREAEKAERLRRANAGVVLRTLLDNTNGRQYMWDILASAHIFEAIPPVDHGTMSFLVGERNQGLMMLNDIFEHCPEHFITMMREANERRQQRSTPATKPAGSPDGDGGVEGSNAITEYEPTERAGEES